jgi:hypothetical protein
VVWEQHAHHRRTLARSPAGPCDCGDGTKHSFPYHRGARYRLEEKGTDTWSVGDVIVEVDHVDILFGPIKATGPLPGPAPAFTFAPNGYYGIVVLGTHRDQVFSLKNWSGSASGAVKIRVTGSSTFTKIGDTCSRTTVGAGKT